MVAAAPVGAQFDGGARFGDDAAGKVGHGPFPAVGSPGPRPVAGKIIHRQVAQHPLGPDNRFAPDAVDDAAEAGRRPLEVEVEGGHLQALFRPQVAGAEARRSQRHPVIGGRGQEQRPLRAQVDEQLVDLEHLGGTFVAAPEFQLRHVQPLRERPRQHQLTGAAAEVEAHRLHRAIGHHAKGHRAFQRQVEGAKGLKLGGNARKDGGNNLAEINLQVEPSGGGPIGAEDRDLGLLSVYVQGQGGFAPDAGGVAPEGDPGRRRFPRHVQAPVLDGQVRVDDGEPRQIADGAVGIGRRQQAKEHPLEHRVRCALVDVETDLEPAVTVAQQP